MLGIDILQGNAFDMVKTLPDQSIDCVLTSPPYFGLRDYGMEFQLGLESTPEEYVEKMVKLFRGIKCALKGFWDCLVEFRRFLCWISERHVCKW